MQLYRDPSKRNAIADSAITTCTTPSNSFHIHKTDNLSILNVQSLYVNNIKIVGKLYLQGALMRKSHNIAFNKIGPIL